MSNMGNLEKLGIAVIVILVVMVGIVAITPKEKTAVDGGPPAMEPVSKDGPNKDKAGAQPAKSGEENGGNSVATEPEPTLNPDKEFLKAAALWIQGTVVTLSPIESGLTLTVKTSEVRPYIIDCSEGGGGQNGDDRQTAAALRAQLHQGTSVSFPRMLVQSAGTWKPVFNERNVGTLDPDFVVPDDEEPAKPK